MVRRLCFFFVVLALTSTIAVRCQNVINVNFAGLLGGLTPSSTDAETIRSLKAQLDTVTAANSLANQKIVSLQKKLYNLGYSDTYAPIPNNSFPFPTDRSDGMIVKELGVGTGVYFISDTAYSSAVIDVGDSLDVIDAPPTYSEARLRSVISSISATKPVTHFIYTHTHNDHVGLAGIFASGNVTFISHPLSVELITRNGRLPIPSVVTSQNNSKLTIGDKQFEFYYYDDAHEIGNMLIWLPQSKVMIYIDIIYPQWAPFYALGMTQDAIRFVNIHDTFLSFDFNHFIPGHLGRTATRDDIILAKKYLADMKSTIISGLALYTFNDYYPRYVTPRGYNWWALLHNWQSDMASYCADKIIEMYRSTLAGVELYAWSHCWHYREHIDLYQPTGVGKKRNWIAETMARPERK
eukprot:TRINITY_DN5963_c0_g1_i1.p1 TRINITY_DN5963_c0_g1~~TRINITY_DN5963_c0_g1_i1.p1  ORF type:complete len:409 (+),score=96.84 TRINITY_DN5963_c0_g1_i1:613-1839(+)